MGSAARAAGRLPSGALPQGSSLLWSVLEQCLRQQAEALFEQHSYKAAARDAMAQVGDLLDPPNILPCDAKCPGTSFGRHDFRGSHNKGIVGGMSRPIVELYCSWHVQASRNQKEGEELIRKAQRYMRDMKAHARKSAAAAEEAAQQLAAAQEALCQKSVTHLQITIASTLNVRPVFRCSF